MSENGDNFNMLSCNTDDEEDTLQSQALIVPPIQEDEDLSGPPMDGFEFLKRVVVETRKCDAVVVKKYEAKQSTSLANLIPQFPEKKKCSPELCMDKEMQLQTLAEFSKLRSRYEERRSKIPKNQLGKLRKLLPKKYDEEKWLEILTNPPSIIAEKIGTKNSSIEVVLSFPQLTLCAILEYMEDWITEGELGVVVACQWIYMLLACRELPLEPETHATLREIARALISSRSEMESITCEELPHINVVICIIGRYFNQYDLADPMD